MLDALEPLGNMPGVSLALLVTTDGVPIAFVESEKKDSEPDESGDLPRMGRVDALAALGTNWCNELRLATAPLSWSEPERVVMRCARGSLVMRRLKRAILLVLLERGVAPEDVRLSMDGVACRIERAVRSMGGTTSAIAEPSSEGAPIAALPKEGAADGTEEEVAAPGSNCSARDRTSGN